MERVGDNDQSDEQLECVPHGRTSSAQHRLRRGQTCTITCPAIDCWRVYPRRCDCRCPELKMVYWPFGPQQYQRIRGHYSNPNRWNGRLYSWPAVDIGTECYCRRLLETSRPWKEPEVRIFIGGMAFLDVVRSMASSR
jgi:hypothetical protein